MQKDNILTIITDNFKENCIRRVGRFLERVDTKMNCVGILMLQIPEVRLNIISNLDCVNQGKICQSKQ